MRARVWIYIAKMKIEEGVDSIHFQTREGKNDQELHSKWDLKGSI